MSERRIRTAGLLIDAIVVSTNTLAQCGGITNGVSVDDSSGTLCGVLDWEDLKTAVQEIARNRGETLGHDRADGAAQERAAIVAWLRADGTDVLARLRGPHTWLKLDTVADAIERGKHNEREAK